MSWLPVSNSHNWEEQLLEVFVFLCVVLSMLPCMSYVLLIKKHQQWISYTTMFSRLTRMLLQYLKEAEEHVSSGALS